MDSDYMHDSCLLSHPITSFKPHLLTYYTAFKLHVFSLYNPAGIESEINQGGTRLAGQDCHIHIR